MMFYSFFSLYAHNFVRLIPTYPCLYAPAGAAAALLLTHSKHIDKGKTTTEKKKTIKSM